MKRLASVHMTAADFMRDKALKEDLPEFAAVADQLDDYEELKTLMHSYVTSYARLRAALRAIAENERPSTYEHARLVAQRALHWAQDL